MAVRDTINSIKQHIEDAYGIAEEKQAVIPEQKNLANLADCVASISGSEDLDTELNDYKNGLDTEDIKIEDIVNAVRDKTGAERLSAKEKDINFYDYDGTCVYSYTLEEFQNVQELPQGPTHEGLIFQEWNWDLQDIKDENGCVDIGATYTTDDGCTRIYIELPTDSMQPLIQISLNGKCIIDWGDNTPYSNLETTTLTLLGKRHKYTKSGNYIISIQVTEGFFNINGWSTANNPSNMGSCLLWDGKTSSTQGTTYVEYNRQYQSCIKKIEIGNGVKNIGYYGFSYLYNLETLTISKDVIFHSNTRLMFTNDYVLKSVIPPKNSLINSLMDTTFSTTHIRNIILPKSIRISKTGTYSVFSSAYTLKKLILPSTVTGIPSSIFNTSSSSLHKLIFNGNIETIGASAFYYCYSIIKYDFTHNTQVPTLSNTNAFQSINASCKIVVPDNLYDEWIAANNWSNTTIVSHIVKESEYDG